MADVVSPGGCAGTGFSPNDLVFGHTVRGPLAILRDDLAEVDPPTNLIDYVNESRHHLFTAVERARENLNVAQLKIESWVERCQFSPGDQVLVLTPILNSPFQAKFTGPYTVEAGF